MKRCPYCGSPDIASLCPNGESMSMVDKVMRSYYPDAEHCVDCEGTFPQGVANHDAERAARLKLSLSNLRKTP